MNCIFCKEDSSHSKSVEHIVPESLGNKTHILSKGIVCDKCNQYFARKVEKKVLELDFFRDLRHRNGIESKKRKIPKGKAIIPLTNFEADVIFKKEKDPIEVVLNQESFDLVKDGKINHIIIPENNNPPKDNVYVSRFLAKIAFEMLHLRVIHNDSDHEQFVNESQFDPIRNYSRFNSKQVNWVYHVRKIYDEHEKFYLKNGKSVDMVFECDFFSTKKIELYFVIAFKGFEFVLNMAGSSIEGFIEWLNDNNNISPLYRKGSNFGYNLTPNFIKENKNTDDNNV